VVKALGDQARAQNAALENAQQSCATLAAELSAAEKEACLQKARADGAERKIAELDRKIAQAEKVSQEVAVKKNELEQTVANQEVLFPSL
jgi:chromosome segregation ATPase